MNKSVKINTLEVENLKRIKAVKLELQGRALCVIGGKNGQGKTSVLDSIAYALGGERYRPSNAHREGSMTDPEIRVTLSNGITVERKGKNSALKVMDPSGGKGGQQLLNEFLHAFALDLPKFMAANSREKADTLLQIIGVGAELAKLDREIKRLFDERHAAGRIHDSKAKFAAGLYYYGDVPDAPVNVSELIEAKDAVRRRNTELESAKREAEIVENQRRRLVDTVARLRQELADAEAQLAKVTAQYDQLTASLKGRDSESTDAIDQQLAQAEEINAKVRANLDKRKAIDDAEAAKADADALTAQLEAVREQRSGLLRGAQLPLDGLSVDGEGELTYLGKRWDCMSGAEQLRVSVAITKALNPACGFVLLDKLEQMDADTLAEFGAWLEAEGLQAIATRVSTGDECSIIIEDGIGTLDLPIKAPAPKAAPLKSFGEDF